MIAGALLRLAAFASFATLASFAAGTRAGASAHGTAAPGTNRLAFARIELSGPLEAARIRVDGSGECLVSGRLLSGERRELSVPCPAGRAGSVPSSDSGALGVSGVTIEALTADGAPAAGGGRVLGFGYEVEALELAWRELPAGLRARSLPGPAALSAAGARGAVTPGSAAAALALVALALVLGSLLRARPLLLVGIELALAALLFAGPFVRRPEARAILVLEGAGSAWLAHSAAQGALEVDAERVVRLVSEPADALLALAVALEQPNRFRCAPAAGAPRGSVVRAFERLAETPRISLQQNDWRELVRSWVRTGPGLGEWSARGRWSLGEPPRAAGWRPAAASDPTADAPPGWAVVGLPQGVPVVVGELAEPPGAWLRWVGSE